MSQRDPKWSNLKLGVSSLTVGGHGCTTTAIAMGLTKLFPRDTNKNPGELARFLQYTDANYAYGEGLLLWTANNPQWNELGIQFVGRYQGYSDPDREMMDRLSKSKDHFVIIEVARYDGGRHWLHCQGNALTWRGYGMASDDPINAKRLYKTTGMGAPYHRIMGCAVFKTI